MSDEISCFAASYLDASAAVKLVLDEPGSSNVNKYFAQRVCEITALCLAEALGVLKRKWLKGQLSQDQYLGRCYILLAYMRGLPKRIHLDEIDLSSLDTFSEAEKFARQYNLDLSDALQLVSVKHGKFRCFVQESKTILITADSGLEKAAKAEGLRVWNCVSDAMPPLK